LGKSDPSSKVVSPKNLVSNNVDAPQGTNSLAVCQLGAAGSGIVYIVKKKFAIPVIIRDSRMSHIKKFAATKNKLGRTSDISSNYDGAAAIEEF
jgi:hypothetical protein